MKNKRIWLAVTLVGGLFCIINIGEALEINFFAGLIVAFAGGVLLGTYIDIVIDMTKQRIQVKQMIGYYWNHRDIQEVKKSVDGLIKYLDVEYYQKREPEKVTEGFRKVRKHKILK